MLSREEDLRLRETIFAWLRVQKLHKPLFSRQDLASFEFQGRTVRLIGTQTGIWWLKGLSEGAVGIWSAYVPEGQKRPYEDTFGDDGFMRYKWRGSDSQTADNRALRFAMENGLPLVFYKGIAYEPGTMTQIAEAIFPVYLIAEEPQFQQFVVAMESTQHLVSPNEPKEVLEITRSYNERITKVRYHQPLFRARVLHAYEQRCAVCRLPFAELLEAAHIKPDSEGGPARVSNGLSMCKIHHGAYDANILGISPEYQIEIKESVLATFDGPTLQHSLKEMHGEKLRQVPSERVNRPDRDLLAERFERFQQAS
jgi:putative restriction endonuclease